MQIVATIRNGHRIITEGKTYEVYGSLKLRGRHLYQVVDIATGKKLSLARDDVLQAQREGSAKVA